MAIDSISYLYFFIDTQNSAFKVGVSLNPLKRSLSLSENIDINSSLQFTCKKSDVYRIEKTIHFLYDADRIKKPKSDGFTEWFSMAAFEKIKNFVFDNQDKLKWISYGPVSAIQKESRLTGISRRGFNRYSENPSLFKLTQATRRISNIKGDKMLIVSQETGEIIAPAGFHEVFEVDKTQFVKLYLNGVKAFQGLSSAGAKVFELIYVLVQGSPGTDEIALHYSVVEKQSFAISMATFKRGMRELLEKEFIYESTTPNLYWLNIDYLFNGNRLAFIKEFRLKEKRRALEKIEQSEGP